MQCVVHDVADEKKGREREGQQHARAMRFPVVMFDEIQSHAERHRAQSVQKRVEGRQKHPAPGVKCLALGSVTLVSAHGSAAMLLAFEEKEMRKPTPPNVLGPFYKKRAPETAMLRAAGDPGMPLSVSGPLFNTR